MVLLWQNIIDSIIAEQYVEIVWKRAIKESDVDEKGF
jgi:hypothetical protein